MQTPRLFQSWPRAVVGLSIVALALSATPAHASEADLVLPSLQTHARYLGGHLGGTMLLCLGFLVGIAGLVFGLQGFTALRKLPVHKSMLEVSELIYSTCKTYVVTQGKFLALLWAMVAPVIAIYFGFFVADNGNHSIGTAGRVVVILFMSLVGMAGSVGVAYFGIRVNTFANSRAAHASLAGRAYPIYGIPLRAGISIGMVLISVELLILLAIILCLPSDLAGPSLIGFAIGESLGAAALRVAGGIFTKIADIGADLMKIVFHIKEDDARNPGVIADCVGDNAGDSVGPTADGFETYGVTAVALVSFILLGIKGSPTDPALQSQVQAYLLVWIFAVAALMVLVSGAAYVINEKLATAKYGDSKLFDFEKPLTNLVLIAAGLAIVVTYVASFVLLHGLAGNGSLWWKLATIVSCGTAAAALIPEVIKVFTSTHSRHVREIVTASREGGAGLNVLSGLSAGNFSAFWVGGIVIMGLMALAFFVSEIGLNAAGDTSLGSIMNFPGVFALGLVAFGFLSLGPVTIAVDSYGPVTDNAQSVYELSLIETQPGIHEEMQRDFGMTPDFEHAKALLEENDGAGNTFKATAKPVLIGTAVVGATTMIFSIIMTLLGRDAGATAKLSILHPPFFFGVIGGGAVIYWFSGASCQAVITGAYRAVEYIKHNLHLEPGSTKASESDSKKVVEICTKYAQKGMLNIFVTVFFITLAAAFVEEYFFIGFLIGLAIVGLFQAIFMANAGGAWDNAKKVVETELRAKGTPLHDASVVGDIVGDPFKDTSSVALNPIIKFSTLFGLLAVELAITITKPGVRPIVAIGCLAIALFFVYRSFYGMRIGTTTAPEAAPATVS